MDYWHRRLGQVHRNESFGHTERTLHRILRCISINLTEDLCLLVKRIHLHLHKLCLNSRNVLEILGLAKFLHERKSGRKVFFSRGSEVFCSDSCYSKGTLTWSFVANQNNFPSPPEFVP